MEENATDRIKVWEERWEQNDIRWHSPDVHKHLQKHKSLLFKEGETKKFFVPLCGKTVDMKWLSDQGHTVVGVEGVRKSLEDFCSEQGLEWSLEKSQSMGPGCEVMKIKDRQMKLYVSDIFLFNNSIEGQFDCIWDRGSLASLDRNDVKAYATSMKSLLKPDGKMLVEVFEYDVAIFEGTPGIPPPFPVFEEEMNLLFGQDCSVELVGKDKRQIIGNDVDLLMYLITKK